MDYEKNIKDKFKDFDSVTGKTLLMKSPKIVISGILGGALFKGSIDAAKRGEIISAAFGGWFTAISLAYFTEGVGEVLDSRPSVREKIEAKLEEQAARESNTDAPVVEEEADKKKKR